MAFFGNPNAGNNASLATSVAGSGGANINAAAGTIFTLVPAASETLTASVVPAGYEVNLIITTSGTTSYTITFGTGFKSTGTLATGIVSGKVFALRFISDGTNMVETARTTAM